MTQPPLQVLLNLSHAEAACVPVALEGRKHGSAKTYAAGCRCRPCTDAQAAATSLIRQRQRAARVELEKRLAARLRAAVYHNEPWIAKPDGLRETVWENEIERFIRRLERGYKHVRDAPRVPIEGMTT